MKLSKDERELLEGIASDMGASRISEMSDAELIDYIVS